MTDQEIIEKLNIKPSDRVLDVGGSTKQHDQIAVDTIADIVAPEKAPYWPSKIKAKKFVKVDLTSQKLPFTDKEFDVCLCTHTLEDLYNPFLAISEMSRVAKRGCIVTPARGKDMEYSPVNLTDWLTGFRRQPGLSHHHWLTEIKKDKLYFIPKNYPILYSTDFHITRWMGPVETCLFWREKIQFEIFNPVDTHKLIAEYKKFLVDNRTLIKTGQVLIYLDNPILYLKEMTKFILKRGNGFKYL